MFKLTPHSGDKKPLNGCLPQIRAKVELLACDLAIHFEYNFDEALFFDERFVSDFKNWSLWDWDVFEIFLTRSRDKGLPYLEGQVSPLNQKFALLVENPRKKWAYPKADPFRVETRLEERSWKSSFYVPVKNIPGNGDLIKGNLHAIVGRPRRHFSLTPNAGERADFHRPDLFTTLARIEPKIAAKGEGR